MRLRDRFRPRHANHPAAPPGQHPRRDDWLDADSRRRVAEEVTYGTDWIFDDPEDRYSLIWNSARGELYTHRHRGDTVAVLGAFPSCEQVDSLLVGWEQLHDEAFGGYMVCGQVAAHKAAHRKMEAACYGVVLRVDGTAEPVDRPLTYHDIQTVLGGVAVTTADEQQPVTVNPLVAAYANTIHLDRNAHRDLKPVNDAATSLHGGRWPIRGDAVIAGWDPQVALDRSTVDSLLRLPGPADPTAPQPQAQLPIATICHDDWLEADPRRRQRWETRLSTWPRDTVDPDYEVMYNNGSDELYLLHCRTGGVEEFGVFEHIGHAHALVHRWSRHRHYHGDPDNPAHLSWLREAAAASSLPVERDVAHDAALATYAQRVATDHDFTVRFSGGRHQPVRFRFQRPGVDTHLGQSFNVSGPLVEPTSPVDIDAALTDFVDNWRPEMLELDSDWAKAEADYVEDGIEWTHRQREGDTHPEPVIRKGDPFASVEAPQANEDPQKLASATDPLTEASPARQVVAEWSTPAIPPAGPDGDLGGIA